MLEAEKQLDAEMAEGRQHHTRLAERAEALRRHRNVTFKGMVIGGTSGLLCSLLLSWSFHLPLLAIAMATPTAMLVGSWVNSLYELWSRKHPSRQPS